jgi:hypothetical protein
MHPQKSPLPSLLFLLSPLLFLLQPLSSRCCRISSWYYFSNCSVLKTVSPVTVAPAATPVAVAAATVAATAVPGPVAGTAVPVADTAALILLLQPFLLQ